MPHAIKRFIANQPRPIWILHIAMIINTMGSSFLWPMNTIYMTQALGKSMITAGVVLMLMASATAIGNMLGGWLFDRIGGFRTTFAGVSTTLTALVCLNINHDWPYYAAFLMIIGLGQGIVFPSLFAMVGTTWPSGARKAYSLGYLLQNVGFAVGTALGGFAAAKSFNYSFMGFLSFYIVFFLIVILGIRHIKPLEAPVETKQEATTASNHKALIALLMISFAFFLCWIGYVQWQNSISVHVTGLGLSLQHYGLFWTLNGVWIIIMQPLFMIIIQKTMISIKTQIAIGLFILMGSFWLTANIDSFFGGYGTTGLFWGYMIAMAILTTGEILIWPAIPTIANQLAPGGKAGLFQGISNTAKTVGIMFGPLFGSIMLKYYNLQILFYALMGFMVIALVFALTHDRVLSKNAMQTSTTTLEKTG